MKRINFNFKKLCCLAVLALVLNTALSCGDEPSTDTTDTFNTPPTGIGLTSTNVAENQPIGTFVGIFNTNDSDTEVHSYTLVNGEGDDDNASFTINNGVLQTTAIFDFEIKSSYRIRVQTDDGKGGTFESAFTIAVTDANDAPTAIALSNSVIDEEQPAGLLVGTFTTTDRDSNVGGHIYSLVSGDSSQDNSKFSIRAANLYTLEALDFESQPSYTIRVLSKDNFGATFEQVFVINVNNVSRWALATSNAAWPGRRGHASLVFDNKMWVMGGINENIVDNDALNDVWSSSDGVAWTQVQGIAAWPARRTFGSVVYRDSLWVIGGVDTNFDTRNDVWASADGVDWVLKTANSGWPSTIGLFAVVFKDSLWVSGDDDRSTINNLGTWSSSDGVVWNERAVNPPFLNDGTSRRRYNHQMLVFNNSLWLLGGYGNTQGYQDVWSSDDGVSWIEAQDAAAWGHRFNHTAVVFDDKMWVMGGTNSFGNNVYADAWTSTDGRNWTKDDVAVPWGARRRHTSVVFDNKIWILGGSDARNDVWFYEQ